MLKTYLYLPNSLDDKIVQAARTRNESKAETIRQALEAGLTVMQQQESASARVMLKIAEIGKKYKFKGPKDLSTNLDKYLWGIEK